MNRRKAGTPPNEGAKAMRAARRKTLADLRRLFAPLMWDSGFRVGRVGNSRPMKLWAPKDARGTCTKIQFNGHALTDFWGFSEVGVITDVHGGGCVTEPLARFCLEDLLMLHRWAVKHAPGRAEGL